MIAARDGRVAIFSIEATTVDPLEVPSGQPRAWLPGRWVAVVADVADAPAGAALLALGLAVLLVIGLRLTH